MKALTVWPEIGPCFTWLGKDVENRTWEPPASVIGQRIAIHVGRAVAGGDGIRVAVERLAAHCKPAGFDVVLAGPDRFLFRSVSSFGKRTEVAVVKSAIIATVRLLEVRRDSRSPWAMRDHFHWVLGDVRRLGEPIPCRGHLGLWEAPRLPLEHELDAGAA